MNPGERGLYDAGRRGDAAPTHLDVASQSAYDAGRRARKRNDHGTPTGGLGGAWLFVVLAAAPFILAVSIGAAVPALIAAPFVAGILRLFDRTDPVGFWRAFRTCFWTNAVFLLISGGIGIGAYWVVEGRRAVTFFEVLSVATNQLARGAVELLVGTAAYGQPEFAVYYERLTAARPDADTLMLVAAFALFVPAWLAAGKTFAVREGDHLGSRGELVRALLVTALILLPIQAGALWATARIAQIFIV
jgi:hypothetical protein